MKSNLRYKFLSVILIIIQLNTVGQVQDSSNQLKVFDRTLDSSFILQTSEDSLNMSDYNLNGELISQTYDTSKIINQKMKSGPLFEFGIGKSYEVSRNWGNYYYEKESYNKAIQKFSLISDKDDDILRKMGKSFLNLKMLDSAEFYFKIVADSSNSPIDYYNYSHILYVNEKFNEAEKVRKKYADVSDENRASLFNENESHENIFSNISDVDLINLSINTKNSDFGAFAVKNDSSDNYSVLYTSADEYSLKNIKKSKFIRPDYPTYDIFKSSLDFNSMTLTSPSPFSGELKNQYQEGPAIMTNDLKTIYFTRSTSVESQDDALYLNLFKVGVNNINNPDSVLGLSINNEHYSVMHPTITDNGERMYFSSDMPGGNGGMDLYYCEIYGLYKQFFLGDTTATRELIRLSKPVNLGNQINTEGNEVFPFHMDDKTLFFASDGRIGFGGLDIYMVNDYLDTNKTDVQNMGIPFNSSKDDFSFFMSNDLKFGFISSNREGGVGDDDIYCFKTNLDIAEGADDYYTMVKGELLTVENNHVLVNDFLHDTINDFMNQNIYHKARLTSQPAFGKVEFNENGSFTYMPNNNQVDKDHFTYKIMHDKFMHDTIHVYLNAIDKTVPVAMDDHYIIKEGKEFTVNSKDGTLHNDYDKGGDSLTTIIIDQPMRGSINFNDDGSFVYKPNSIDVSSDTFHYAVFDGYFYDTAEVTLSKLMEGVDIATVIEISPIYFDVNKSNIRPDASVELDKIVDVMNEYPSMIVELGSHTDCRASYGYNRSLSDRRAKSSANYIKSRITGPERIYGKGYGESKLKNKCECEGRRKVDCTEDEHQENRRTEFLIIKMD